VKAVERRELLGELEVRADHDADAVPRGRGAGGPRALPPRPVAPLADAEQAASQPLLRRIPLDCAAVPVDDDRFLGGDRLADAGDTHHRRESERPGDDRRVGRRPPAFEHERAHATGIEPRRVDRRDLVGDQDRSARELRRKNVRSARQVTRDLSAHVVDVRRPLAHGVRVRGLEAFCELPRDLGERPLRVDPLAAHPFQDDLEVGLVRSDQPVRLEDRGQLRADLAAGFGRVPAELLCRQTRRAAEPPFFVGELVGIDRAPERGKTPETDDDGAADREARGNGKALEHRCQESGSGVRGKGFRYPVSGFGGFRPGS